VYPSERRWRSLIERDVAGPFDDVRCETRLANGSKRDDVLVRVLSERGERANEDRAD